MTRADGHAADGGRRRPGKPQVEVVIPVHSPSRPIRRAVESVFAGTTKTDVSVTVVCHRTEPQAIERQLAGIPRVRLLRCDDAAISPAAPVNLGLEAADAKYFSRLDSDDEFEPGAIDAWMRVAARSNADVVISPLRHEGRRVEYAPLTRPFRHGRLDAVRDRLSYRTAVFGLVRLDTVRRLGARYTTGLRTGEDIEFGLRLWFDSPRIDYAAHAPAYLVHHDATDRTLASDSTFRSDLAAASAMIATPWLAGRSQDEKLAIAVKLARVHLFDAARRVRTVPIEPADADAAVSFVSTLDALAPGWRAPFNRADARALESLATGDIGGANSAWDAATRRDLIFAPTALGTLHRESTLRRYLRYRLPR